MKTIKLTKDNTRDYLMTYVNASNALTVDDNQLNNSEKKFFVDICYLKSQGVDVSDYKQLVSGMKEIGNFTNKKTISQYKTRLSIKTWIRSGFNKLDIPEAFDLTKTEPGVEIKITIE